MREYDYGIEAEMKLAEKRRIDRENNKVLRVKERLALTVKASRHERRRLAKLRRLRTGG